MKKIYELLRLPAAERADVGIEIEIEGENLRPVNGQFWRSEDDGSLRGMYPEERGEYVLKQPILITQVKEAMKELNNALAKSTLNFSFRTSVHVHVNVQNLTELQLINMVYTYMLIEEPLMNFCGKERKCNRFCLRLQDSDGVMDTMMNLVRYGAQQLMLMNENHIRYSALNLASIKKYGTVEFRGMRGTADAAIINTWASALVALRTFAVKQENPQSIYDKFVQMNGEGFLEEVLGDHAKSFIYPKMIKDLQRSFSLSIEVPFEHKKGTKEKKIEDKYKDFELDPGDIPPIRRPRAAQVNWNDLEAAPVNPVARNVFNEMALNRGQ